MSKSFGNIAKCVVWDSVEPNPLDMDTDDDGVPDGEDGTGDANRR